MKIPDTLIDYPTEETADTVYQFLQSHPVGVLAEVMPSGYPHASAIYFNVDNQFTIYFVTKTNTQKYKDLQQNQQACLVAFDQPTQATVQISGKVTEITDSSEVRSVVDSIENIAHRFSISGVAPIIKLDTGDYVAYELKPDTIRFAMYLRPDPVTYDAFETLAFRY